MHESLGITVVYVTHDQSEALTMSDRIAVFNDGVDPADRHAATSSTSGRANAFVAHFIGENNVLTGTVEAVDGRLCRVRAGDDGALIAGAAHVNRRAGVAAPLCRCGRSGSISSRTAPSIRQPPAGDGARAPSISATMCGVRVACRQRGFHRQAALSGADRLVPTTGEKRFHRPYRAEDCLALDPA